MTKPPQPNRVIRGDALAVMREWPEACIDHCIADPPFNMSKKKGLGWAFSSHVTMQEAWDQFENDDFFRFNVEWLREVCRVVKPNGNIIVFGTYHNIYQLGFILQSGLHRRILNSIVWYKPNAQPNITARMLTESTEQLIWAVNGTPSGRGKATGWTFNYWKAKELSGDKQHRNLLPTRINGLPTITIANPVASPKEKRTGRHPSQKPVKLVETLISLFTKRGDLVLDPFAGTGALGQAAIRRGREYLLIEKNPKYHAIAQENVRDEKRNPSGALHRWAELKAQPLSEQKIDALDAPVPQADRLSLVVEVIESVREGTNTRTAIGKRLSSDEKNNYTPRQGAYYADAAMVLGWVRLSNGSFVLTERGETISNASGASLRQRIWEDIKDSHFGFVADDLDVSLEAGISDEKAFASKLGEWFGLAEDTAKRRVQTLRHWIDELKSGEVG